MANNNLDRFKKDLDDLLSKSMRLQEGFLKETDHLIQLLIKRKFLKK